MIAFFTGLAYGFLILFILFSFLRIYKKCKKRSILDDAIVSLNQQTETTWKQIQE